MAAIDHAAYAPASPFAGLTGSISSVARAVRTHLAYRQTLNSLSSLSRRQLDDIGLDGANLEVLARDMANRNTL
jgi:uncharacterized protein YjiS (DUF1127 family)